MFLLIRLRGKEARVPNGVHEQLGPFNENDTCLGKLIKGVARLIVFRLIIYEAIYLSRFKRTSVEAKSTCTVFRHVVKTFKLDTSSHNINENVRPKEEGAFVSRRPKVVGGNYLDRKATIACSRVEARV